MTNQDKRDARARMAATGEKYTDALRAVRRSHGHQSSPSFRRKPAREGPAFARRRLAAQLWALRTEAGLSETAAAEALRMPPSTLTRIEAGLVPVHDQDLDLLLLAYGSTDAGLRQELLALAETSRQAACWDEDPGLLSDPLRLYLALEAEADTIMIYSPYCISDLAQAGDGAPATFCEFGESEIQPEMGPRIAGRRQGLLELPDPPLIWVLIRERALFEMAGGWERMRRQLTAMRASCERPRVTVQIVPDQVPAAAREPGPFAIVRLDVRAEPGTDFAYEDVRPATAPEDAQASLDRCNLQFQRLAVNAVKPDQTIGIINRILDVEMPRVFRPGN